MGAGHLQFRRHAGPGVFLQGAAGDFLQRILDGRPQLKYFEAGMDLRLSTDPYESFRIFQGRILEQYLAMSTDFKFLVIDANQPIEAQQASCAILVAAKWIWPIRAAQTPLPRMKTARPHLRKNPRASSCRRCKPRRFYGQGVPMWTFPSWPAN
jgi:hypothetical protein